MGTCGNIKKFRNGNIAKGLWIRAAPFTTLRDLIFLLTNYPDGLSTSQIKDIILNENKLRTAQGRVPSRTTLFHYRNILKHLGVLRCEKRRYCINFEDQNIQRGLQILQPYSGKLLEQERCWFSELILKNEDCRHLFFDLFMAKPSLYDARKFIEQGTPVRWNNIDQEIPNQNLQTTEIKSSRKILFQNVITGNKKIISSEDEFQAILYGVRLWALNELKIIDEFYYDSFGRIMFPIGKHVGNEELMREILLNLNFKADDWVICSVKKMIFNFCIQYRISIAQLMNTFSKMKYDYPQFVVFIPTSKNFATINAISKDGKWSKKFAEKQLKDYFLDDQGRYISHIRFHRKLKEVTNCEGST